MLQPVPRVQRIQPVIEVPNAVFLHPNGRSAGGPTPLPVHFTEEPNTPNPDSRYKFVAAPRPPRVRADGTVITTDLPEVRDGIQWEDEAQRQTNRDRQRFGSRVTEATNSQNPDSRYQFVAAPRPPRIRSDGTVVTTVQPEIGGIVWGEGSQRPQGRQSTGFSGRRRGGSRQASTEPPFIGRGARWFSKHF